MDCFIEYMSPTSPTHFKIFLDQGVLHAALFSGTDQTSDWLYNVPATEILISGFDILPHETLISFNDAQSQGFIAGKYYDKTLENKDVLIAWHMRAARLAALQSESASSDNNPALDGSACARVLEYLEGSMAFINDQDTLEDIKRQRLSWLLRGVEAYLKAWHESSDPLYAEALCNFFLSLANISQLDEPEMFQKALHNYNYWVQCAVNSWMEVSRVSEIAGDILKAEEAAQAALRLMIEFEKK